MHFEHTSPEIPLTKLSTARAGELNYGNSVFATDFSADLLASRDVRDK